MPTFLRIRGFRFYVYAQEGAEPAHVHIDHGSGTMKVWLADLSVARTQGLKPAQIKLVHCCRYAYTYRPQGEAPDALAK